MSSQTYKWMLAGTLFSTWLALTLYVQYSTSKELQKRRDTAEPLLPVDREAVLKRRREEREARGETIDDIPLTSTAAAATNSATATNLATTTTDPVSPPWWLSIDNIKLYDDSAESYDRSIDWEERTMWLKWIRARLLRHAEGNVLEMSTGTGRNIPYYPHVKQLESVTFLDASRKMLEQTIKTFNAHQQHFEKEVVVKAHDAEGVVIPTADDAPLLDRVAATARRLLHVAATALTRDEKERREIPIEFYRADASRTGFPDNHFDTGMLVRMSGIYNQEDNYVYFLFYAQSYRHLACAASVRIMDHILRSCTA